MRSDYIRSAAASRSVKLISSRENPGFRKLLALHESAAARREQGRALLEGIHLVAACLEAGGIPETVVVSESAQGNAEVAALLHELDAAQTLLLTDRLFERVAQVSAPVGIAAVIAIPAPAPGPAPELGVLLEDIQDPGNVGTILRSAAAAGAQAAWLSQGCADPWSPRVLRAAMGAHFRLALQAGADLAAVARAFHGRVLAAVPRDGRNLYECCLTGPIALVLGSEGSGVSAKLLKETDEVISIPMAPGAESLNAAAAAAVCLFEMVRQRSGTGGQGPGARGDAVTRPLTPDP
jgi:TrmH family RNA methyltransferase